MINLHEDDDCGCGHDSNEGKMAKHQAMECADDAQDVANMIMEADDLPEWLEAKITLAADYMNKVKDYMTHYVRGSQKTSSRDSDLKSTLKAMIPERIEKVDNKWVVYPKDGGKRLGTHDTKKQALRQLAAIEINKGKK